MPRYVRRNSSVLTLCALLVTGCVDSSPGELEFSLVASPELELLSTSPGYDATPTIKVTNLEIRGGDFSLYVGGNCDTLLGTLTFPTLTSYIELSPEFIATGTLSFSAKVSAGGGTSDCSNAVTYTLLAPPAPSALTLISPSTSPGFDPSPTVRLSGVSAGLTAKVYTDSTCTTEVGSKSASGSTVDLDLTLTLGSHALYARTLNGNFESACSGQLNTYEVAAPPTPSSLSLVTPSSSPGYDPTPTVQVGGIQSGLTVKVFTDASCTTQVGSATSYSSTVNITTSALAIGAHSLYARTETAAGQSSCSATSVAYEVTYRPAPTALALSTPAASPHHYRTPIINVTLTPGTSLTAHLYGDSGCTSSLGSASATSSPTAVKTSALAEGTHVFYAKITGSDGSVSQCSTANVSYEVVPRVSLAVDSTLTAAYAPYGMDAGDLNGDGKLDLVTAHHQNGTVKVFTGNGDGTFQAPSSISGFWFGYEAALRDFNGDGDLDLAVTSSSPDDGISVLMGNGDGTFQTRSNYGLTSSNAEGMCVADFDQDGTLDIAAAVTFGYYASVLLNNGDGTFQTAVDHTSLYRTEAVAAADVNNDGFPDMAVVHWSAGTAGLFLNNGDGTFGARVDYPAGTNPTDVIFGDFNEDGFQDMASAGSYGGGLYVMLNDGDGTFAAPVRYSTLSYNTVHVTDIDADGNLDLIATGATDQLSLYYGKGDGTFELPEDFSLPDEGVSLSIGDFDGNLDLDIAVGTWNGGVTVFLRQ